MSLTLLQFILGDGVPIKDFHLLFGLCLNADIADASNRLLAYHLMRVLHIAYAQFVVKKFFLPRLC